MEVEDKEPLNVFFDIEAMQTQERYEANLLIAEKEEEEASHAFRGQGCVKDFCCGWNSWWKRKIGIWLSWRIISQGMTDISLWISITRTVNSLKTFAMQVRFYKWYVVVSVSLTAFRSSPCHSLLFRKPSIWRNWRKAIFVTSWTYWNCNCTLGLIRLTITTRRKPCQWKEERRLKHGMRRKRARLSIFKRNSISIAFLMWNCWKRGAWVSNRCLNSMRTLIPSPKSPLPLLAIKIWEWIVWNLTRLRRNHSMVGDWVLIRAKWPSNGSSTKIINFAKRYGIDWQWKSKMVGILFQDQIIHSTARESITQEIMVNT